MDLAGRELKNQRLAEQLGCMVKKDDATIEWTHTPNPIPGGAPLVHRVRVDHEDCYSIWDLHVGIDGWVRSPRPSGRWTIDEVEAWLAARLPNVHKWTRPTGDAS